jgi:hypothetical protein
LTHHLVPVVLLPREVLSLADMVSSMSGCSYLYLEDGDNTQAVENHIMDLYKNENVDMLFIAEQDVIALVQRLSGKMPLLFAKVLTVLPFYKPDMLGIPLRFDTKLYMYEEDLVDIGYVLYETYSVIQGEDSPFCCIICIIFFPFSKGLSIHV